MAFQSHRGGFAAADAQARHAALQPVLAQRADQRHDDARAGGADRVAERAGAAVHVDLVVRQAVLLHRRHGHHREGLVDLVEIDLLRVPAGSFKQLPDRADGRGGEPRRLLRMRGVADHGRERRKPTRFGRRAAHHDERRRAVGDRARVGRRHRAVLAERRLERRNLLQVRLERLLVHLDELLLLAGLDRDRRDLPREQALLVRLLRAVAGMRSRTRPAPAARTGTSPPCPRRRCPSAGPCRRRPRGRRRTCGRAPGRGPCAGRRAPSAGGTARWSWIPCRRRRSTRRFRQAAGRARTWRPSCRSRTSC